MSYGVIFNRLYLNQRFSSEFKTHLLGIGFSILILFCFKEKHATLSRRNLRKLRRSYFLKYVLPGQSHYKLIFTMRLCYFWPFYGE